MDARLRIGVLFGGISEEHDVSVKSAQEVAASLDPERYDPIWIHITRDGAWRLCDGPAAPADGAGRSAVISPDREVHGLLVEGDGACERVRLDVVLPVLHGKHGEDGSIQGLLELAGIPYIGCDIASSALCMDKALAYLVAESAGIPIPGYSIVRDGDTVDGAGLVYPVFVKPARSGSSFGVGKVDSADELPAALAAAREFDSKVLVEEGIVGKEVGCAILGTGADLTVGDVDRVALSHGFLRIHQEQNPEDGSENAQFIVPADIPDADRQRVQQTAVAIYRALGCSGLARVDLFLADDGRVLLNEVNTLPGLTSYSRYPRMMASAGIPLSDVIDRLVALAIA
ncbi:MAG: D-alanine--D-alanine ligase family protein [Pseudoclavibacter sp.]